jgi:myo-inositol-1(or 4)-monophosphatase
MNPLRPHTVAAVAVAGEAVRLAAGGTGAVHAKHGRDVVTDSDVAVEDLIRDALASDSGWPVIGEERGGEVTADTPYWLVDPICGTRNYASGIPLYSVNIALVEGGAVTIAVVGDASTGEIMAAERGRGARVVRPSERQLLTDDSSGTVDVEAWPTKAAPRLLSARRAAALIEGNRWDIRSFSTTLSLAYVACGRLAACVLFETLGVVHTAAGSLLVAEAGGTVTDLVGHAWGLESSSLLCAASAELHRELLELMQH